jgi:3-oxoacyl-[acyl-carrier-protein] synthase II
MKRRVAITGMGAVTPIGLGVENYWQGLINGRSGVAAISAYDASTFPTGIAAEIRNFHLEEFCSTDGLIRKNDKRLQYTLAAAQMAIEDAGLVPGSNEWVDCGIYLGAGEGAFDLERFGETIIASCGESQDLDPCAFASAVEGLSDPLDDLIREANIPAAVLAGRFGATGFSSSCLTACAASSQAIGEAMRAIQRGDAEIMIAGGAHAMTSPLELLGFSLLSALSRRNSEPQKASRPFDAARDGFVLGEGAGILILEELSHAQARGAHIHAELVGYGLSCDAYRLTDMHPEARGPIQSMRRALEDAGRLPEEIDYINAHGTSTRENDRKETLAIKKVFEQNAYRIPVSSTKSMTGHLVAAAGVIELIASILAIQHQVVPPTINYEFPDPDCDLDYVPNQARAVELDVALSNSFGFGGQNVTLIIRRFTDC